MKLIFFYLLGVLFSGNSNYFEKDALQKTLINLYSSSQLASESAFLKKSIKLTDKKIFGSTLDLQDRKALQRNSPRTMDRMDRGDPLTINDVIKLSQSGVDEGNIISYMKDTGSAYHLSQSQVRRLQDAGVSQHVIDFMLDSGR